MFDRAPTLVLVMRRIQRWREELLNARPRRQFELAIAVTALSTLLLAWHAPHRALMWLNLACAGIALMLIILHRLAPRWHTALIWVLWGNVQATATIGALMQGGLWSSAMGYFFVSTIGMMTIINLRAILMSVAITVMTILSLGVIEASGHLPESLIPDDDLAWPLTLFSFLMLAYVMVIGVVQLTQKRLGQQLRQQNAALTLAQDQLRQQHLMQEQFVASVSHELRTPMNAIMGFLQTIDHERRSEIASHEQEMLDLMTQSASQLLLRINELLDFSQLQAGKLRLRPHATDLRAEVTAMLEPWRWSLRDKPVELRCHIDEALPPWLQCDAERFAQIANNLLSNAAKFTQQGHIALTLGYSDTGRLTLDLVDTGAGIPPEDLSRIFDRLSPLTSRTRRELGGTGLGLSIVRALVQLMGGELQVSSQVGVGSRFCITIPMPACPAPAPDNALAVCDETTGHVLIVDDSPINRLVAQNILQAQMPRLDIVQANGGIQALERLSQARYDLVLMDLIMPDMNGFEATQRIQAQWGAQAPLIIGLSADLSDEAKDRSERAGMLDMIHKPFDRQSLCTPVMRALRLAKSSPPRSTDLFAPR